MAKLTMGEQFQVDNLDLLKPLETHLIDVTIEGQVYRARIIAVGNMFSQVKIVPPNTRE